MSDRKYTRSLFQPPHLSREGVSCNCANILDDNYCGGIAEIMVSNGKPVSEGGNDCPPLEEAKANGWLMASSQLLLHSLEEITHRDWIQQEMNEIAIRLGDPERCYMIGSTEEEQMEKLKELAKTLAMIDARRNFAIDRALGRLANLHSTEQLLDDLHDKFFAGFEPGIPDSKAALLKWEQEWIDQNVEQYDSVGHAAAVKMNLSHRYRISELESRIRELEQIIDEGKGPDE